MAVTVTQTCDRCATVLEEGGATVVASRDWEERDAAVEVAAPDGSAKQVAIDDPGVRYRTQRLSWDLCPAVDIFDRAAS